MKRKLTLSALIVSIILNIFVIANAVLSFIFLDNRYREEYQGTGLDIARMNLRDTLGSFIFLFAVALILAIVCLFFIKNNKSKFAKKKGWIIATLVFNFLNIVISSIMEILIVDLGRVYKQDFFYVIIAFALAGLIAANIMLLLDLRLEKKRDENGMLPAKIKKEKVVEAKVSRPLLLTAFILSVSFLALGIIFNIVEFVDISNLEYFGFDLTNAYVLLSFELICFVVAVVLNIISLVKFNSGKLEFAKYLKVMIAAVVFNFASIILALLVVALIQGTLYIIIGTFVMAALIATNVLAIIGLVKGNKSVAVVNKSAEVAEPEKIQKQAAAKFEKEKTENKPSAVANENTLNFDFEVKIKKLNDMKKSGLITEEEYSQLKAVVIKEYLNK